MLDHLILQSAREHNLDARLVGSLVQIESGGNQWAWNPEPRYRYFWNVQTGAPFRSVNEVEILAETPPADFRGLAGDRDQEWWAQQASWGLMQVMGAVARELGCKAPYLTSLCDPALNLHWGCVKLRKELTWAGGVVERALASYNGGHVGNIVAPYRNAAYAAKVMKEYATRGGT